MRRRDTASGASTGVLDPERIEAVFDAPEALTIGLEEEVMLLDPDSLELAPVASEALEALGPDPRFKPEMPASQLEILTEPATGVDDAIAALAAGRRDLVAGLGSLARPAAAGVHPFSAPSGALNDSDRYAQIVEEYGPVARRQLVASLQVHVAPGSAERALAAYNGLRERLPEIAALAANARVYDGRDSGFASVRPKIAESLPRQGMPPALSSWEELAGELRWGRASGRVAEPRLWWWELRPHLSFGTLEVRVPDAQATLAEAAAVAAVVHSLVCRLCEDADREGARCEAPSVPSWRLEENRWSAARHGVEGEMADPRSGTVEPTHERISRLLDEISPAAERLGCDRALDLARDMLEANGALRQRELVERGGAGEVAAWLAEHFLDEDGLEEGLFRPLASG